MNSIIIHNHSSREVRDEARHSSTFIASASAMVSSRHASSGSASVLPAATATTAHATAFHEKSRRRYGRNTTRGRRSNVAIAGRIVDLALAGVLVVTLCVTRALLARRNDVLGLDSDRRRPSAGRARRAGPRDDDGALALGVRAKEWRSDNSTSYDRPLSLYGRAAALADAPGFPDTPPLVLSVEVPKAYLLRNFLSESECDHLMNLAKQELAPSTVVGDGGTSVSSNIRTSAGMFLRKGQDEVVRRIEERIARASGTPEKNGEGIQILRYDKGQKYDPHYDYFHDKVNPAPKRGGQRVATVLIYLVDTEEGGETTFPNAELPEHFEANEENNPFASNVKRSDCAKRGIPVKSVRGDAILFFSMTSDGALDSGSLHGACPVVAGQKWTAVKWIRVAEFDGNFQHELPMIPLTRRTVDEPCVDEWSECEAWARDGWCERNPEFMTAPDSARDSESPACARSCGLCAP